jgi:hypothetical protein
MGQRVSRYQRLNGKYLNDAEALLKKGDYSQASEKYWGAAAEMTKAYAEKKGRHLKGHADLFEFVEELEEKHPKLGLYHLFLDANHLHSNFYEDDLPPKAVNELAKSVKAYIKKLKDLMQA